MTTVITSQEVAVQQKWSESVPKPTAESAEVSYLIPGIVIASEAPSMILVA